MKLSDTTGWRTVALINIVWLTIATFVLFGLVAASSVAEGGATGANIFFRGPCHGDAVSRLNTALHLLLNVFSSAVLASSSFFIQVVSAPTRAEVDAAHARGRAVHIGVTSPSNALHVSRFKAALWAALLLTSLPLHLLFNAAVFEVDAREASFTLLIADEGFSAGAPYHVPGASLAVPGLKDVGPWPSGPRGYGEGEKIGEFVEPETRAQLFWPPTLARNVTAAAASTKNWTRLEKDECAKQYTGCSGLQSYGDVIVVVESRNGWARHQVWSLGANATEFWDKYVPGDQPNSLWFSAECKMQSDRRATGRGGCENSCAAALGASDDDISPATWRSQLGSVDNWTISFFGDSAQMDTTISEPMWNTNLYSGPGGRDQFGLRNGRDILPVRYCLARPVEETVQCGVGVSNAILLCVAFCTLLKTATAAVVLWHLGHQRMFVTLGDAIASFIAVADKTTLATDYLTGNQMTDTLPRGDGQMPPTAWRTVYRRSFASVGPSSWLFYGVLLLTGPLIFFMMAGSFTDMKFFPCTVNLFAGDSTKDDDDGFEDANTGSFLSQVMVVNSFQLGLSIWYLIYNGFLTRLQMAREWARFSTEYRPLRVTKPEGKQVSTYRLQLPYRYSVPLLAISAFLHWMMSNAFYIFVGQGSYFQLSSGPYLDTNRDSQLPPDSVVSSRHSAGTLLAVTLITVVMVLVLLALAWRRLPGYMPVVGDSSLLISAACHISPLAKVAPLLYAADAKAPNAPSSKRRDGEDASSEDASSEDSEVVDADLESMPADPEAVSQAKVPQCWLKWGVVEMPPEWLAEHRYDTRAGGVEVQHVGFGTLLDHVADPVDGKYYD